MSVRLPGAVGRLFVVGAALLGAVALAPAPASAAETVWVAWTDGDGARCRADAAYDAATLVVLPEGDEVALMGAPLLEWVPVWCAGTTGYVHAAYLSWSGPQAAAEVAAEADAEPAAGQALADFALGYVGAPYVWAGEGPWGFDCSGFTLFVAREVLGLDISHDLFTQIGMGAPVGRDDLAPGDLVFFGDTFMPGLSHVGIYVGDGQFVHAENESTGTVVSSLDADYYAARWYGAVRLA